MDSADPSLAEPPPPGFCGFCGFAIKNDQNHALACSPTVAPVLGVFARFIHVRRYAKGCASTLDLVCPMINVNGSFMEM